MFLFWKKKPDPMGPLTSEINALRTEIRALHNVQSRVVFPADAMNELTGELRALRHLLDEKGRYAFMDSILEKKKLEVERAQREEERKVAAGGKGGHSA